MQVWRMIEGACATQGAQDVPTFGVAVTLSDGGMWQWADVDTDPTVAYVLVCRLQALQPAPCHFEDRVRDFIEEMAGKV